MWKIGNVEIENQIVLAPMAGVCNSAFRSIIKEFGAGLIYAEMVSSNALIYENKKTTKLLDVMANEHPLNMQIFGGDSKVLVEAAKLVEQKCDADIIDINMGCPVGKVTRANAGSKWLLREEEAAQAIYDVVRAVNKPVTVKMRLGWDQEHINILKMAKLAEEAGAKAIAIHGRTKSQMYSGQANLEPIKEVKKILTIPVIGNGDVRSPEDAKRMLEFTNCDAVMIGRGALGDPWLIKRCVEYLDKGILLPEPTYQEKFSILLEHARRLMEIKPEVVAIHEMRGHALWYVRSIPNSHKVKNLLGKIDYYSELEDIINKYSQSLITNDFDWLR